MPSIPFNAFNSNVASIPPTPLALPPVPFPEQRLATLPSASTAVGAATSQNAAITQAIYPEFTQAILEALSEAEKHNDWTQGQRLEYVQDKIDKMYRMQSTNPDRRFFFEHRDARHTIMNQLFNRTIESYPEWKKSQESQPHKVRRAREAQTVSTNTSAVESQDALSPSSTSSAQVNAPLNPSAATAELNIAYDSSGFSESLYENKSAFPVTVKVKLSNLNGERVTQILSNPGPEQPQATAVEADLKAEQGNTVAVVNAPPVDPSRYPAPPENPPLGTQHTWRASPSAHASKPSTLAAIGQIGRRKAYLWSHGGGLSQSEADQLLARFSQAGNKIEEMTSSTLWGSANLEAQAFVLPADAPIHFLVYATSTNEEKLNGGGFSFGDLFSLAGIGQCLHRSENFTDWGFNRAALIRLENQLLKPYITTAKDRERALTVMEEGAEHELAHLVCAYQRLAKFSDRSPFEPWIEEGLAEIMIYAKRTYSATDEVHRVEAQNPLKHWIKEQKFALPNAEVTHNFDLYLPATAFFYFLIRQYGLPFSTALRATRSFEGLEPIDEALRQVGCPYNAREMFRRWGALLALPTPNATLYQRGHGLPKRQDNGYTFPEIDLSQLLNAEELALLRRPLPATLAPLSHAVHAKDSVSGELTEEIAVPPYTTLSVYITPAVQSAIPLNTADNTAQTGAVKL